jgi:hypothetical protein
MVTIFRVVIVVDIANSIHLQDIYDIRNCIVIMSVQYLLATSLCASTEVKYRGDRLLSKLSRRNISFWN